MLLCSTNAAAARRAAEAVSRGQGFGAGRFLGHTVRVALSRNGAFCSPSGTGHTTGAHTGASGPHLDRDDVSPRESARGATHPTAGTGEPQTGKQRRHSQRAAREIRTVRTKT